MPALSAAVRQNDLHPGAFDCDAPVVGDGIDAAGIARCLAKRGWRVALSKRGDLASHTSLAFTKLIHGALRYLEHHGFAMVRAGLQEREVLMKSAPHTLGPPRFVMPRDARTQKAARCS